MQAKLRFRRLKLLNCGALVFLLMALPVVINAQVTVKGTVTKTDGAPIPGISVIVAGTTYGTVTNDQGAYSINSKRGDKLQFSGTGYVSQEAEVRDNAIINIELAASNVSMDEVVVVGYGTMRKKDLTGSVVQIKPDDMANANPNTVQDILRGVPGLQVGYDPSAKGGGSLQVRGQRSVYTAGGHNNPLIILDGMIFYGELSEINPDDIGQIDVLKDASAAAVYGAQAANGVIIITTKKGKIGKPVINVSANAGFTTKSAYRGVYGPDGYMQFREDWYKKDTYGLNAETGNYEPYQTGTLKGKLGYYDSPDNLAQYGITLEQWRAYTTNAAGESDASIYARRLNLNDLVLANYVSGRTFNWYDHTFRTGFNQDYNASVSGASDKMNYYLSFGHLKNEGAVVGNMYRATRANMKLDGKITKWLQLGANVNFQDRSDGDLQPGLGLNYWDNNQIRLSPYASYRDSAGNLVHRPMGQNQGYAYNFDFNKQFIELEKGYTVLNSILTAKVTLPFNITYSFNAAPRYQFFYDRYFESSKHPDWKASNNGLVNREQAKRFDWSLNNTINWEQTFATKHRVNLTLVQEAEERRYWQDRIEARNILPSDALGFHNTANGDKTRSSFSSSDSRQTADALFGRLFYSYDSKYMLTATVRRDGYSAFGANNPYGIFPSIALAWAFTNEKFFNWEPMNTGKLRVSYGKNGNRALADPYIALANLGSGTGRFQGYLDGSGALVNMRYLSVDRLANPNLQWEKTAAYNIGLDYGFLNNRISGSIEYYVMNTHDMIMSQRLPGFSGFNSIATNLGEVSNRGVEFTISTLNLQSNILQWSTTLNFSYNKNRIKHLYYQYENVLDEGGNVIGTREMNDNTNGWFIGQPIGAIWDYRVTGIWQASEVEEAKKYGQKPGDPKVANNYTADDKKNTDGSTTPVYNDKDREFMGPTAPPVHWQLRNDFTLWKSLALSFNLYSYMGHKSIDWNYLNRDNDGSLITNGLNTFTKEYWTPQNPTHDYARLDAQGPGGVASPGKVYDRSFIRFESISLGYTLPKTWTSKYQMSNVKIYGSVRNVAVWQKDWEYGDPETGGLATRIFSLGLNVTF